MALTRTTIEMVLKSDSAISEYAKKIAKEITSGICSITDLVDQLGFALTSTNLDERLKATMLLSSVLAGLPKKAFNMKQLEVLTCFYADRLKDNHNLIPAVLTGIDALISNAEDDISLDAVLKLLETLNCLTTCQQQVASDRTKIFKIIKFLTSRLNEENPSEYIQLIIRSIDGEYDPQNLDFVFSFMPEFLSKVKLGTLAEDMFEIFAVYFPLDYTPSKNVLVLITRENLADKLGDCLVANIAFADDVVELALEKLDSDLSVAKLESIKLLEKAAMRFPADSFARHFDRIWNALKSEFLSNNNNENVINGAIKTLSEFLKAAASTRDLSSSYQIEVIRFVMQHLMDVNSLHFQRATTLALICITADVSCAVNRLLPIVIGKPPYDDSQVKKYKVMEILLAETAKCNALCSIDTELSEHIQNDAISILEITDNHSNTFSSFPELQQLALNVLAEIVPIIDAENRNLLYSRIMRFLKDAQLDCNIEQLIECLGIAQSQELLTHFIDPCIKNFRELPNIAKQKVYAIFNTLTKQFPLMERVVSFILLNAFEMTLPAEERLLALNAFNDLLAMQCNKFIVALQHERNLIHRLIEFAQNANSRLDELEQAAIALSAIVQNLAVSEQYVIVNEHLSNITFQNTEDLYITKGLLAYLHVDINLDIHLERLLSNLIRLSLTSELVQLREISNHLIASLVNRTQYSAENRSILVNIINQLKQAISAGEETAVQALAWLSKGLIICGYENAADVVQALATLLDHPNLRNAAVLAFDIICAEYPQLHLPVTKFLYKQKFFHLVFKSLEQKLNEFCFHHLNAFIYVLKATPHAVLKLNIEKVGPVLLKCLESLTQNTVLIATAICENFIQERDTYFAQCLGQLIKICISLSQCETAMNVRQAALELLYDISKYPTYLLLPHKVDVTMELAKSLDDPKRLVRQVAVKTRNAWCLVGAPGE